MKDAPLLPGRGTALNPANRFERIHVAWEPIDVDPDEPAPKTEYYWDDSKAILSENNSPDLPFRWGLNPYRGCEHGCAYCYARPYHEYLGMSAGLDFESKIVVKRNAAALLRAQLMKPSWQPEWITMSGVTDCYQPAEIKFKVTRSVLEVMAEFRQPVGIITKNALVTRDIDLLAELARHNATGVTVSITTLDEGLRRKLEPRTATAARRIEAIRALTEAGVPAGVNVAPIIPGLNEYEIPAILDAAKKAGARWAGMTIVRLPFAVAEIFEGWVRQHYPDRADKVMKRIRECRDGDVNSTTFVERMKGTGPRAEQIRNLFKLARQRAGFTDERTEFNAAAFRRPGETRAMF